MTRRPLDLANRPAPSRPPPLPFYNRPTPSSPLKSTLLQVLIAQDLKSSRINTYEKPRGRASRTVSLCYSLLTSETHLDPAAIPTSKPFGITSFADPHLLNPLESHLYQEQGRGYPAPP